MKVADPAWLASLAPTDKHPQAGNRRQFLRYSTPEVAGPIRSRELAGVVVALKQRRRRHLKGFGDPHDIDQADSCTRRVDGDCPRDSDQRSPASQRATAVTALLAFESIEFSVVIDTDRSQRHPTRRDRGSNAVRTCSAV